jgi:hypothetical protein
VSLPSRTGCRKTMANATCDAVHAQTIRSDPPLHETMRDAGCAHSELAQWYERIGEVTK